MPSPYYVGGTQQYVHHETDPLGGAIAPQPGAWSVSNPAVARISQSGLAEWLAPGTTDIVYIVDGVHRAGAYGAEVRSAIPAVLTVAPGSVVLVPEALVLVRVSALDALGAPITPLALDAITSDDATVATIVPVLSLSGAPPEFLVLGVGVGTAIITVTAGLASATVLAVVDAAVAALTEAEADARYRLLSERISDSEVTKTPVVDKGDVSGAVARAWSYAERSQSQRLVGDAVTTLTGIPVGEFLFMDVAQDSVGGHQHHFAAGAGLPPLRWDYEEEPTQTPDHDTFDSFMFYNRATEITASRTWEKISTI